LILNRAVVKNITHKEVLNEVLGRIEKLTPTTKAKWGKMTVSQMMAHCTTGFEVTLGSKIVKHSFLGKIFGKMAKKQAFSDKPFGKGLPTDPNYVVKGDKDFNAEKMKLIAVINRYVTAGEHDLTKGPHPFFGKLTADEWNELNYKHIDHHLKQFGV
jgi:Protein of unknown function (DUF1569)